MNKTLKRVAASFMAIAMVLAYMPTFGLGISHAAETTCHIGESYYATLAAALEKAKEGDTIVIDSKDAGEVTVTKTVKIDVGSSEYDVKQIKVPDDKSICEKTEGTVTSYALHEVPATDGGVVFNWDDNDPVNNTTVTIKDANGHTKDAGKATVTAEGTAASCEKGGKAKYTAKVTYGGKEYTDTKTVEMNATGHKYAVKEEANQDAWWDGTTYNKAGVPVVKGVKVYCVNEGESSVKDATVEYVEFIPSKTNPPTCTKAGEGTYTFKVLYNGETIKDVTAAKAEDRTKDKLISITDKSVKATGKHVATTKPTIEYKAYDTKEVDGKVVFVSKLDPTKTVTDKKDAKLVWVGEGHEAESAYGQGYDDVLTYRIVWVCDSCGVTFYDDAVEVKPTSTTTKFYLDKEATNVQKKDGKEITAADNCTASSIETGTFAPVKRIYNEKPNGQQDVADFTIKPIDKPAKTDYEPQHNSTGVAVQVNDPSHTEKGNKHFVCADCGQDVNVELPTVGEHKFKKDSLKTVEPTCTTIGYTYQICETCEAAHLKPVGTDGKEVKDLPADFQTEGAIVSATKPALGHNFVVLNSDRDVRNWTFNKDSKDGHYIASCVINYECARCRDPKVAMDGVTYTTEKEPANPAEKTVYEGLSTKVTKAKDCTENDVVTVTADGVKDYNAGKDVSKDFADQAVIGDHSYVVKTVNYSADGKSANATIECSKADKCKGEKKRVIAVTSTASKVDEATGLTTYTASISDADLKAAEIAKTEINTAIPEAVATKKVYDLSGATVTVPNYTEEEYAKKADKDVVVKIGNATIDPKFYEINWPKNLVAPELKAELTVTAKDFEDKGVTATGTSEKVTFEVTKSVNTTVDPVEVKVNDKDPKGKVDFTSTYNGKNQTLVATTKTKDAKVSYLINDKAADKVELKDVYYDEDGEMGEYVVNYVIRYADGTIYESEDYTFEITPATVKIIKTDYDKLEGQDDPAIEFDSDKVAEGDNLELTFEKHSETPGTYKLDVLWKNNNYTIAYPTYDAYLTLTIKTDASVKADAEKAGLDAAKVTAENGYDEASVKAVADAKAKLDEAVRTGDTAAMKDATKALNDAIAAADAAKDAGSKEEMAKDADKAVAAAKDITEANGYSKEDAAAVKAAADAVAATTADPKATSADIAAATKKLNDAMEKAEANKAAVDAAKAAAAVTAEAGYDQADVDAVKKAVDALAAAKAKAGATAADIQAATKALNAAVATANANKAKIAKAKKLTVKGLKVTAGKKKATVKFKKTKGATAYQIQYRIKGKKWKNLKKSSKKVKVTAKKLKKGKKYQFKVRTITKVGKKNYYGKWTKVKTVKIKK